MQVNQALDSFQHRWHQFAAKTTGAFIGHLHFRLENIRYFITDMYRIALVAAPC